MKKKLLLVFSLISLVFISWKFSSPSFNDPDKDKLLIEVIKYVLDKYHYKSIEIDDQFSKNMFNSYFDQIDSQKKYFLASDINEFKKFEYELDDLIKEYDLTFFDITHKRLIKRIKEVEDFYPKILSKPFNFSIKEDINVDFENMSFPKSNKDRVDRWRKQLKYSALDIYDLKLSEEKINKETNPD